VRGVSPEPILRAGAFTPYVPAGSSTWYQPFRFVLTSATVTPLRLN